MRLEKLDERQKIQEEEYDFPYHYLLDFSETSLAQYREYPGGIFYAATLLKILLIMREIQFDSVVDIGCGDGFFCRKLSVWFPDKRIVGIDYSVQAVSLARLLNRDRNIEFLVEDITASGFDRRFDVATSISVLEHIQPPLVYSFVKGMHSLLASGGELVISVPSTGLPVEKIPKHYQHFTEESLSEILSEFFEIVELNHIIRRFDFMTWLITRLLDNRWFLLKQKELRNWLFRFYLSHRLPADASNSTMLFAVCRKR